VGNGNIQPRLPDVRDSISSDAEAHSVISAELVSLKEKERRIRGPSESPCREDDNGKVKCKDCAKETIEQKPVLEKKNYD
jgi:hypothetical protein